MRCCAVLTASLAFSLAVYAAKKPQPIEDGMASDPNVSIKATVYADPATIQELLGNTLDGHYIVIKIDITPNKKFLIDHDNFLLRTNKDGERAKPYEPTQIAGDGALVVSNAQDEQQGNKKNRGSGVTMGGMGGIMGGSSPGVPVSTAPTKVVLQSASGNKSPMVKTLEDHMLPQKEVEQPTSGLLYFPMEKQKVKDLELFVTTPSGKLDIRFSK
jgi:hypothetical protein